MSLVNPVLILGMHRSGTSCLTGCLQEAGLYLGNVNTEAGFNKKGNRENRDIMDHHDRILSRSGASWSNPPAIDPVWTEEEKEYLSGLLETYAGAGLWGLKDPRTLFMLEGWKSLTTPNFVGTFRHPYEVASSLVHRAAIWNQPMDIAMAYDLWASYNKKLLSVHKEQPFDIIRYDIPAKLYNLKLIRMTLRLGLNPLATNSFREENLHNQHKVETGVPKAHKGIWEALNDLAI